MTEITPEDIAAINSFPKLVSLLRDKMEWPLGEDYGFDDVVYEYDPRELGFKPEETAKIREIHQLRPLVTGQPWGIFFVSFEDKKISVTVLRRMLRALVLKKRSTAQAHDRQSWKLNDLIFVANFGGSGEREIAFAHFSENEDTGDLPVMKVLGWNAKDTKLHNEHVGKVLRQRLIWPEDDKDIQSWRQAWRAAFELRQGEAIQTSKGLALKLAELAIEIRARANELLALESDSGPMRQMHEAFRKNLIQDLDADGFSDMFAQTISYGMLAAKISRPGADLIADNLADMVPRTNPFLKELFGSFLSLGGRDKRKGMDFDELGVNDVVDMLNAAKMDAVLRDFGDKNPKEDPVIHFYELFLKEYDPEKRVQRGVFYTPRPVVNFIVRGVDEVLRTEFGLPLGLANTSTWAELAANNGNIEIPDHIDPKTPFVQILDPATGTGTFIVETIDLIYANMTEHWTEQGLSKSSQIKAWNDYVPNHLLPRLTAFELMMAPYAIAHMKVGLKLSETGYTFGSDERARIFLTNALEPARDLDMEFLFMSEVLANESGAANRAKAETAFTIVIGNPPYASLSANLTKPLRKIVDEYRYVDGIKIRERNMLQFEKNIQDDYVKFIRISERESAKNHGIFSLVTNHGYLDAPTLRGVRQGLKSRFDTIEVIDLHGNSNKNEALHSGNRDFNIFPIQQGVSLIRGCKGVSESFVKWGEIWGTGEEKENLLSASKFGSICNTEIDPRPENYLFIPRSTNIESMEWDVLSKTTDIYALYSTGVETGFDRVLLDFSEDELIKKLVKFDNLSTEKAIDKYEAKKGNAKKIIDSKEKLSSLSSDIVKFQKHPFDYRALLNTKRLLKTNADKVFSNVNSDSPALVVTRQTKENFAVLAVQGCSGHKLISSYDRVSVFPLWLNRSSGETYRRPNIDRQLIKTFGEQFELTYQDGIPHAVQPKLGDEFRRGDQESMLEGMWDGRGDLESDFGPRDLFDYIYAVLHSPGYRARYAEFLKSDFPRIPTPKTRDLFAQLIPLGRTLVSLHLVKRDEAPVLADPDIRFAGTGEARVEKGFPKYENGKVMINDARWFEDVPRETWEFYIGGYQVCHKWLKDRAAKGGKNSKPGRVLTDDDIMHYRRTVTALTETRRIMTEIDNVIETHGGWPDAFAVSKETERDN